MSSAPDAATSIEHASRLPWTSRMAAQLLSLRTTVALVRRRTAFHEAGHVIVGAALGLRISTVEVNPPGGVGDLPGIVRIVMFDAYDTPSPWAEIARKVAGIASAALFDPDECLLDLADWFDLEDGPDGDVHCALAAAEVYGSTGRAWRALREAEERVTRWLRKPNNWACVTEIASWAETRIVTGAEVYSSVERHRVTAPGLLPKGRPLFRSDMPEREAAE